MRGQVDVAAGGATTASSRRTVVPADRPRLHGRPDAVIFDCDGVLVDSEPVTNGVLCEMLNELGLDFDVERTIRTFMGKSVKDEMAAIEAMIGRALPPDWHRQFVRRRDAALAVSVTEIPGVRAVVARLAAGGIPFAVASGAECAKMRLTLGTCGLLTFFEHHMFGADMVPRAKPAPDVYELAMQTLGVAPNRTVVIEDTPTGIRAGVAAGATVFALANLNTPAVLLEAGASLTFGSMDEIPALLRLA
jgi:HAD superfamily hydrolase (TIGR01509 family)